MLFVRCTGGISHNPAESVAAADVAVAIDVLSRLRRSARGRVSGYDLVDPRRHVVTPDGVRRADVGIADGAIVARRAASSTAARRGDRRDAACTSSRARSTPTSTSTSPAAPTGRASRRGTRGRGRGRHDDRRRHAAQRASADGRRARRSTRKLRRGAAARPRRLRPLGRPRAGQRRPARRARRARRRRLQGVHVATAGSTTSPPSTT